MAALLLAMVARSSAVFDVTFRVSLSQIGSQGNDDAGNGYLSRDGRLLAFTSRASNIVPGDTNERPDAFARSLLTGRVIQLSVARDGGPANHGSSARSASADGRFIVFSSSASNLIENDTNGIGDLFVRDLHESRTERITLGNDGAQANDTSDGGVISADGRYVVFDSYATNLVGNDGNGRIDAFMRDRLLATTTLVSVTKEGLQGERDSTDPVISPDGRYVCFNSYARNLVPGDTNNTQDVFLKDMLTGEIERISVSSTGSQGNSQSGVSRVTMSADARFICFTSSATNLAQEQDTNRNQDVFVRDRLLGITIRASVRSDGGEGIDGGNSGQIDSIGRYIAFQSASVDLTDEEDVNGTGNDIFMRDLWTRTTWRISESTQGVQGNDQSTDPAISANGRIVAFGSRATNLVPNDSNGYRDIFIHVNSGIGR